MLLTKDNICAYLLEHRWIDPEATVAGDLAITALPTRNNVFKVMQARGQNCFVKQPFAFDAATTHLIAREAKTYRLVGEHEAYRALATSLPRLIAHDTDQHVLAVEYLPRTTNLHEIILRERTFFPELAARLGEILASFHFAVPSDADLAFYPRQPPWVLQVPSVPATTFFPNHAAITGLLQTVQSHPALGGLLAQLRHEWQGDSLIHGDIKWANFIVATDDHSVVRLIDWELADIGDPAWDVAGLFQSYVCAWIFGFDESAPATYELPATMADFDVSRMQPSVRSFWSAYVRGRGFDDVAAQKMLQKSMRLLGCRMIQTAVEGAVRSTTIPANCMRTVQAASNIMQRPETAAHELLGL